MANKVIVSEQFSLKARDFLKGLIMGIGAPVLYVVQELIPGWDVHPVAKVAIAATITYLLKNYFDKPKVVTVYDTNKKATEVAEDIKK
jgi:hypothetical protein